MSSDGALSKLQEYAQKTRQTEYYTEPLDGDQVYESRVRRTLQNLELQVKEQRSALEKANAHFYITPFFLTLIEVKIREQNAQPLTNEPSPDPKIRILQLREITRAYQSLVHAPPLLPLPDSPLPALLALRDTINLIDQTKTAIKETDESLSDAKGRLQDEEENLRDAQRISEIFEARIEKLKSDASSSAEKPPEEIARGLLQDIQQQKLKQRRDLKRLVRAFNQFLDDYLGRMLAAEDLDGPVVGDQLDIDDETLKAGYSQQGQPKKPKQDDATAENRRQQRNNEIWSDVIDEEETLEDWTEKDLAGRGFRNLVEELLNAAAENANDEAYVDVPKENAAVKFLVRAKVAQFHPDNATKLRIVDFGGEMG